MHRPGLLFAILLPIAVQASAGDGACLECHAVIRAQMTPRPHSAMSLGCATCHTGHALPRPAAGGGHLLTATTPGLCVTCHTDVGNTEIVHAPVKADCTYCHNPHGGPPANLRAATNALCLECHSTAAKARFEAGGPVKLFGGAVTLPSHSFANLKLIDLTNDRGHPVSNHPVNRKAGKDWPEVSCVACHQPHGAKHSASLLVTDNDDPMSLCQRCHK